MTYDRLYKLKNDCHVNVMPCKCISKLHLNVLLMVSEGLQHLIINVPMIKVTCTE